MQPKWLCCARLYWVSLWPKDCPPDRRQSLLSNLFATYASHCTLSLQTGRNFTYTPATNYYGTDSFTYMANDTYTNSTAAIVTLTVIAPPAITNQPQSATALAGQSAVFSVGAS